MKIGIICCEDGEIFGGEKGLGKYFVDVLNKEGPAINQEEYVPIYAVTGKLPNVKQIREYSGFIISGSHHSVNDDKKWVKNLENFVLDVKNLQSDNGGPRLFGICYGHQMIAKALGGKVDRNESGRFVWCTEEVNLTAELKNKLYFQKAFGKEKHSIKVMQSHGESISKLPTNASVLGRSSTCDTEIVAYGDNILTMQGHPEFTKEILITKLRPKNDKLSEEEQMNAIKSFEVVDDLQLVPLVKEFLLGDANQ